MGRVFLRGSPHCHHRLVAAIFFGVVGLGVVIENATNRISADTAARAGAYWSRNGAKLPPNLARLLRES
jgi:hypothetical protein